jgi:pentatricopeptide repeat protein
MGREFHVRFCEGLGVKLPRATRLVICCKPGRADEAMQVMREMMEKLRLMVNEKKTLSRGAQNRPGVGASKPAMVRRIRNVR